MLIFFNTRKTGARVLFHLLMAGLPGVALGQGVDRCPINDDVVLLVTLPYSVTSQEACNLKNDFSTELQPNLLCLDENLTGGVDYLYGFTPQSSGVVTATVGVSDTQATGKFGLFFFEGCVKTCKKNTLGSALSKNLSDWVDSGRTYYLLIDTELDSPVCLVFSVNITAPSSSGLPTVQDCAGAIPICGNIYTEPAVRKGYGNISNELATPFFSPTRDEINSTWYTFTISQGGNLHFQIIPEDKSINLNYVLYDVSFYGCREIDSIDSMVISSNFSGNRGITGLSFSSVYQSNHQTESGSAFNKIIPVSPGKRYMLAVLRQIGAHDSVPISTAYKVTFDSSSAILLEMNSPKLVSAITFIDTTACASGKIYLEFDKNILVASAQANDFKIINGNVETVAVSVESPPTTGLTYNRYFTLSYEPGFKYLHNSAIEYNGLLISACGNKAEPGLVRLNIIPNRTNRVEVDSIIIDSLTGDRAVQLCSFLLSSDGIYTWTENGQPLKHTGMSQRCIIVRNISRYSVSIKTTSGCQAISPELLIRH